MDRASVRLTILGLLLICVTSAPTKKRDYDIYSFHINSTVTSRYAMTVITSRVANRLNQSQEIDFLVKIPKNAFISKFSMTIDGKMYDGVVKQKEVAQQQYAQAVSRGQSAGLVSSVGRTLEDFKTSVTVAALSKVTFQLTYEELLKRRLGKYELLIHTRPTQPVADFKIDVYIYESPGIRFLEVKGELSTNELANAITTTRADKQAWVNFYPTRQQQIQCDRCGETGLKGDLLIVYDVERLQSGDLMESHGYFVHYFAPADLPRISKNVVFIIDQSGSMYGKKMEQTRNALLKILGDLHDDDYFGLITFDSRVSVWKPELLKATHDNLQAAKTFVRRINDQGATDINAAVLKGVDMIKKHPREGSASILILLTDGDPTTGETNLEKIQANVKEAIWKKFPLYCLGFGLDVNFEFLEKMALQNDGAGRRIYEESDAALQLQGFYEEVATPLLTDVQLNYTGAANLTQTTFSQYYNGSEIVVSGQLTDNSRKTFTTEVIAISRSNRVVFHDANVTKELPDGISYAETFLQRLWAYLTVKQLLGKEVLLKGEKKDAVRKQALDLSLKYDFVTPLTSMVVTKPQGEDAQVAHKPKEGEKPNRQSHRYTPNSFQLTSRNIATNSRNPGTRYFSHSVPMVQSQGGGAAGLPGFLVMGRGRRVGAGALSPFAQGAGRIGGAGALPPFAQAYYDGDNYDSSEEMAVDSARHFMKTQMKLHLGPIHIPVTQLPTVSPVTRFLMPAQGQSLALCYDVPVTLQLRLLQDPSSEFSMNGELIGFGEKGFQQIAIHYKTDYHMLFNTSEILFSDGQSTMRFQWEQLPSSHETASVSLILRDKEMDVSMGTARVVVLLHEQDGVRFLWPAVRQRPSGSTLPGLMGKLPVAYQEVQGTTSPTLKIEEQEVNVTRDSAADYSIRSAPRVECWLVPFKSALQKALPDFIVSQL